MFCYVFATQIKFGRGVFAFFRRFLFFDEFHHHAVFCVHHLVVQFLDLFIGDLVFGVGHEIFENAPEGDDFHLTTLLESGFCATDVREFILTFGKQGTQIGQLWLTRHF